MKAMVIDTSAILAVILGEPAREPLIEATRGVSLTAPPSLMWEIGNALSAMMRRGRLSETEARTAWRLASRIPVRTLPIEVDLALQLAARLRIYAYDAYMLQCARQCGAPLLTLDKGLQRAARRAGIPVVEVEG